MMVMPTVIVAVIMGVLAIGAIVMSLMALTILGLAQIAFVANDLFTVFAQQAVHDVIATEHFGNSGREGVYQQWVIFQMPSFQNFHIRV